MQITHIKLALQNKQIVPKFTLRKTIMQNYAKITQFAMQFCMEFSGNQLKNAQIYQIYAKITQITQSMQIPLEQVCACGI